MGPFWKLIENAKKKNGYYLNIYFKRESKNVFYLQIDLKSESKNAIFFKFIEKVKVKMWSIWKLIEKLKTKTGSVWKLMEKMKLNNGPNLQIDRKSESKNVFYLQYDWKLIEHSALPYFSNSPALQQNIDILNTVNIFKGLNLGLIASCFWGLVQSFYFLFRSEWIMLRNIPWNKHHFSSEFLYLTSIIAITNNRIFHISGCFISIWKWVNGKS